MSLKVIEFYSDIICNVKKQLGLGKPMIHFGVRQCYLEYMRRKKELIGHGGGWKKR